MLQHLSWQQFLVAALIFTSVWYIVIVLLLYRDEVQGFFKGGQETASPPEPLHQDWQDELEEENLLDEESLVGKAALPEGMERLRMDQFSFAESKVKTVPAAVEPTAQADKETRLGLVPDVLEELKTIFNILAQQDGSKADFFSLFKAVREKYPKISTATDTGSLNTYIREHVPFHISNEELENLWH
jgi:hypothetical protein